MYPFDTLRISILNFTNTFHSACNKTFAILAKKIKYVYHTFKPITIIMFTKAYQ
jgi:hypothetical protein